MAVSDSMNPKQQAQLLQECVTASVDVSLTLKQLHWNIRGPKFQPIHEFLDVVIDHARSATDDLAERIVTLGMHATGQRATLPESPIPTIPDGFMQDKDVIERACATLDELIGVLRHAQENLGALDAVSEDLVIGIIAELEKDRWMLRSHLL